MSDSECLNINIVLQSPYNSDKVSIPLDKWIVEGPGPRFRARPIEVRCSDDDRKLPFTAIPLEYRNNELSDFLIACQVIEYPWNHLLLYLENVHLFTLISAQSLNMMFAGKVTIKSSAEHHLIEFEYITVIVPLSWRMSFCEIFAFKAIILTNSERVFSLFSSKDKFVPLSQGEILMTMSIQTDVFESLKDVTEYFLPDEAFSDSVETHVENLNGHKVTVVVTHVAKYDCALICAFYDLNDKYVLRWLQIFAITPMGEAKKHLPQIITLLKHPLT